MRHDNRSHGAEQKSNHKKEGDEHVIETKGKSRHRAPNNLRPSGDGKGFGGELDA